MKKLLLLVFALLPFVVNGQEKQSIVKLKNGTELKGVIKSIDPTDAVVMDIAGVRTSLKFDSVLSIEELDTTYKPQVNNDSNQKVTIQEVVAGDPLKDFKGFLLAKGNNVYVYYGKSEESSYKRYDEAGARVIKEKLKSDGFWNVVDNMNQAHFTINYCIDTHHWDKAILTISSWRTGKIHNLAGKGTNETIKVNMDVAEKFYNKAIRSLQKNIENRKLSKKIVEDFTVK